MQWLNSIYRCTASTPTQGKFLEDIYGKTRNEFDDSHVSLVSISLLLKQTHPTATQWSCFGNILCNQYIFCPFGYFWDGNIWTVNGGVLVVLSWPHFRVCPFGYFWDGNIWTATSSGGMDNCSCTAIFFINRNFSAWDSRSNCWAWHAFSSSFISSSGKDVRSLWVRLWAFNLSDGKHFPHTKQVTFRIFKCLRWHGARAVDDEWDTRTGARFLDNQVVRNMIWGMDCGL